MLPLIHSGEVVGILLLGTKVSEAPFSSRDYQLLDSIANHAGTSIANLNLTRKVLEQEKRALAVDMAGGIAHEINNALAPLMGQAQLMEMTLNAQNQPISVDKQKSSLSIIVEMCQRIKKIVLNLSKISEPLHLEKAPVSLNKIAEETIVLMSETAGRIKYYKADNPEANFKLQREFDSQLPTTIGDAQQLSQVFINLIINASDAMEAIGKGTLTVGTRYDREQTSVVGFVEDTGTGIPKGIIDKVLQPYFTTKPKGKGTGLGMAIVRSIIESHNGHLHISSTEGVGTRIEFSLPIAQNPDVK
jgi:signal transduction histidine kinase